MIKIVLIERRAGKTKQKIKIMTEQRIKELEDARRQRKVDWNREDVDELCEFALLCLDGKAFKGYDAGYRIARASEFLSAAIERGKKEPSKRGVRALFHFGRLVHERVFRRDEHKIKTAWIYCTSAAWGGLVDAMVLIAKMGESGVSYSHDSEHYGYYAFHECKKYKPEDPESLELPYIWALVAQKRGCDEVDELIKSFESALNGIQKIDCKGKAEDRHSRILLLEKSESDQPYKSTDPNLLP